MGRLVTNQQKCHFSAVSALFLFAVWFCIYTHAQLRILKFQDSVYQKAEVCAKTINKSRILKHSVVLLRRQVSDQRVTFLLTTSRLVGYSYNTKL